MYHHGKFELMRTLLLRAQYPRMRPGNYLVRRTVSNINSIWCCVMVTLLRAIHYCVTVLLLSHKYHCMLYIILSTTRYIVVVQVILRA